MSSSNNQEDQGNQTSRQVLPVSTAWSSVYQGLTPSQGFENATIVCYRNSALCFVLHSPVLINWLALHYGDRGCGNECICCQLHRLVVSFWTGHSNGDDPETVLGGAWDRLLQGSWSDVDIDEQQDVREFIEQLFSQIYNDAGDMEQFDLNNFLRITIKKSYECKTCNKVTQISQPDQVYFATASFPADRKQTEIAIEELLKGFCAGSIMDPKCEQCGRETEHFLAEDIVEIPEILLINLNRVNGEAKSYRRVKFGDQMVLPDALRRGLADSNDICYELYTVIFHDGRTVNSGHYTAAVKAPTGQWMLINDDNDAEPIESLEKLMDMGRGKNKHSAMAYVCVYRRLPLTDEAAPAPAAEETKQVQADEPVTADEVPDLAQAMPLDELSPTDMAVAVPDSEICPDTPIIRPSTPIIHSRTPSPVGARSVRPALTVDGTISLDGRGLEWTIQQQVTMALEAYPLIQLRPRAKVQHGKIKLTLTSGEEILEGEATISLKPSGPEKKKTKTTKAQAPKPAKTMNTKPKPKKTGTAETNTKAPTSSKEAKPEGVEKNIKIRKTALKKKPSAKTSKETEAATGNTEAIKNRKASKTSQDEKPARVCFS